MEHNHGTDHEHKQLYIHGIISARESKALNELDTKINELKTFDFNKWEPELDNAQLYEEFVDCCNCETELCKIKQCIIIKDFEKCRQLIEDNADELPECAKLLIEYDLLKSF